MLMVLLVLSVQLEKKINLFIVDLIVVFLGASIFMLQCFLLGMKVVLIFLVMGGEKNNCFRGILFGEKLMGWLWCVIFLIFLSFSFLCSCFFVFECFIFCREFMCILGLVFCLVCLVVFIFFMSILWIFLEQACWVVSCCFSDCILLYSFFICWWVLLFLLQLGIYWCSGVKVMVVIIRKVIKIRMVLVVMYILSRVSWYEFIFLKVLLFMMMKWYVCCRFCFVCFYYVLNLFLFGVMCVCCFLYLFE